MKGPRNLGDLQLAILRALWQRREAAVSEVHEALSDRGLALTTIATMLRKMEEKGLVAHKEQGRQFLYRAKVDPELVQSNLVGDLVTRLFDGDPLALVNHLVRAGEIDLAELDDLRRQVAAAEKAEKRPSKEKP
ncbi:MAG: BlaI/MecI/CopY family transcriptional regulator [Planctomycetes bacterium]|nr:BlaI/MecI/CopY family transcriptional regulator [Planctomycetota bacterium]MCC7395883.1 BlaI/MecI/CopY family transcriptional regulator [Planctomycetota bacterium]